MRLTTRLGSLAIVASLALAACSGGGSQIPTTGSGLLQHTISQPVNMMSTHRQMSYRVSEAAAPAYFTPATKIDGACGSSLMFISDFTENEVYIYSAGKMCGSITGLSNPQGLTVDAKGDLYVANTGASNVLEYAPPYTGSPIKTIADPNFYPTDVALCKGYIAVTNIESTSGGAGNVAIVRNGKVSHLKDSSALEEYFDGCDPSGNLFTDGRNSSGATIVNEWALGKGKVIEFPKLPPPSRSPADCKLSTRTCGLTTKTATTSPFGPHRSRRAAARSR